MGVLHNARVLLWGEAAGTAAERKLVRKLDFFIMTFSCLSYFFNYLDRMVVNNAYVSGMKEDLNLGGKDINYLSTILTIGYVLGQVPHGLAISIVPPRIWFPSMVIIWAGITMCMAACQNFSQLAACRFFQGLIEASTYAGTQYIIGAWYKPSEIGKRVGLFSACGQAGTMFAGIMMSALFKTMNGHAGLPGWKWGFIIDGLITLPVAIFGYLYFPDIPETTKASYLSAEERELAISRLPPKSEEGHKVGWDLIKRTILTRNFWLLTIFWGIGGLLESLTSYTCMLLWMRTAGYSVIQNNQYPLGIQGVTIVAILACAITLDVSGKFLPWGWLVCVVQLTTAVILLFWGQIGTAAKFAAFYLAGSSFAIQPIVFTWANIILSRQGDEAARSVILYSMNGSSATFFAFWGVCFYPATDAASGFRNGCIALIAVSVFMLGWIFLVYLQDKRTLRIFNEQNAIVTGVEISLDGKEEKGQIVVDSKEKDKESL